MVSTFLTYETVNRNYKASLDRVKNDAATAREAQYYQENIGKVKTVDDFVDDYRLYSYAMKAYGLEDMTYATAFMKKVLNSDLTDDNSFANKLATRNIATSPPPSSSRPRTRPSFRPTTRSTASSAPIRTRSTRPTKKRPRRTPITNPRSEM